MNLSDLLQPEFVAGALVFLLILQIAVIILLINLHLKITPAKSMELKMEKQNTGDELKQVNERLRNDEKRQEQIRRNYEENNVRDKDPKSFKGPQRDNQERNFNNNKDRDRDHDRGRDRDRNRDHDRDRGRDRDRDRNRNRDGADRRPQGDRPQFGRERNFEPQRNREITPPPVEVKPEVSAPAMMESPVQAPEDHAEHEFSHGRRPIVKRRHLPGAAEGAESGGESPAAEQNIVAMETPETTVTTNEEAKS